MKNHFKKLVLTLNNPYLKHYLIHFFRIKTFKFSFNLTRSKTFCSGWHRLVKSKYVLHSTALHC